MAAWPGLTTIMDGPWAVRFGCGFHIQARITHMAPAFLSQPGATIKIDNTEALKPSAVLPRQ